jgi:hypothetical protein
MTSFVWYLVAVPIASNCIVSRRLGYSKDSIALDIYGHLIPEMQNEAAEWINDLITPMKAEWHQNSTKAPNEMYRTI